MEEKTKPINKKSHTSYGMVLNNKMVTFSVVTAILTTLGLLGLNAISPWAQNFSLWGGTPWGQIFGNGTEYMLRGIASAICEVARDFGIPATAVIGTHAIATAVGYNKFKKEQEDVLLTAEEEKLINAHQLGLETVKTKNIINTMSVSTDDVLSVAERALQLQRDRKSTWNPFKKLSYYKQQKDNEKQIHKSIRLLVDRLDVLSNEKRNGWPIKIRNSQGVLIKAEGDIYDSLKYSKLREMRMIQGFFAKVLDKYDNTDPYYSTLKKYLKKHYKTIELISSSNEETVNKISDPLRKGNLDEAITNFCNYMKGLSAKELEEYDTDLGTLVARNKGLKKAKDAELEIEEIRLRSRSHESEIRENKRQSDNLLQDIKLLKARANAGTIDIETLKDYYTDLYEKLQEEFSAAHAILGDVQVQYDALVDKVAKSEIYRRHLKNILKNSINDRTELKKAMSEIRAILKQAKAENTFEEFEYLMDQVFEMEHTLSIIRAGKKELDVIVGRAGNELGSARKIVKKIETHESTAKKHSEGAKKHEEASKTSAEGSEKHRKTAKSNADATVADRIIADSMIHKLGIKLNEADTLSKEHAEVIEDSKKKQSEFIADAEKKQKKHAEILEDAEKKNKQLDAIIAKYLPILEKAVDRLSRLNPEDYATKEEIKKIIECISKIENVSISQINNELRTVKNAIASINGPDSKIAKTLDVEACYELLSREIESLTGRLSAIFPEHEEMFDRLDAKIEKYKDKLEQYIVTNNFRVSTLRTRLNIIEGNREALIINILHEYGVTKQTLKEIATIKNGFKELHTMLDNILKNSNQNAVVTEDFVKSLVEQFVKDKKVIKSKTPEERAEAKQIKDERDQRLDVLRVYAVIINERYGKSECPISEEDLERNTQVSITDTADKIAKNGIKFTKDSKFVVTLRKLLTKYISKQVADKYTNRTLEYATKLTKEEINEFISYIETACAKYNAELNTTNIM